MCGGSGHKAKLKGTPLETGRSALNPDWVEWLMGWPIGYTAVEPLARDATGWRQRRAWRRANQGFCWWSTDPANEPEAGVTRVASQILFRIQRLKCLGNGQVPLVAAVAWLTLASLLENPSGKGK
jgi:hypothetical protein